MKIRLRRLILWSIISVLAMLAGALGFAYTYITDSDTIVEIINAKLPEFLPRAQLRVDRAQLRPLIGQLDFAQTTLMQEVDGSPFPTARVPWLQFRCDLDQLWKGKFVPREIMIAQPALRLVQRRDGTWNIEGLLADPFPEAPDFRPIVRISRGMIELVENHRPTTMLHHLELTLEPDPVRDVYHFSGTAQGDLFERLVVEGSIDPRTGKLCLERGEITRLNLSESLVRRLPDSWQVPWRELGISAGLLDVRVDEFTCSRTAPALTNLRLSLSLLGATWSGKHLPLPLSDVTASARIDRGLLTIGWLEGRYGRTRIRIDRAALDLTSPAPLDGPLSAQISLTDLELDGKLKSRLPEPLQAAWEELAQPGRDGLGRVTVQARVDRARTGGPLMHSGMVELLDVALCYRAFPMPLEHVRGRLSWAGDTVELVSLETLVGNQSLTAKGTLTHLSSQPEVSLEFAAAALPVGEDSEFVNALPDDLKALVSSFHPTGTIRGSARVVSQPGASFAESQSPLDNLAIDAVIDFNEGCAIRWEQLPYAVRHLSGRLELHPGVCEFNNVRGENGVARLAASGRVQFIKPGVYAGDVRLHADRLPFDQQLRDSLPSEWQATWGLLNPTGTTRVEAHIVAGWPDRPDRTWLQIDVAREDEARVKLRLLPVPGTPGLQPGQVIEMPTMQDVRGRFVFDNGVVSLHNVEFAFREAPVKVAGGRVHLRDTGQFDLRVDELEVRRLRFDAELRRIMPPLMAEFARRVDEGKPISATGNLTIAWSGDPDEPAVCAWDHARVFFQDNAILGGVPLKHIQGQIIDASGRSDGRTLEFAGRMELDSFIIAGQQISMFQTDLSLREGRATLNDISARFLGGQLRGRVDFSLDTTPEYRAWAELTQANLAHFTQTIPGRQDLSGTLSGFFRLTGVGNDLRRLNGSGEAHLRDGDLGKLPWFLTLISPLGLARDGKAAFDAADVAVVINDGVAQLDPIRISGRPLSLHGRGTINPQSDIDLEFTPAYGRDERPRLAPLTAMTREASGEMFVITAKGTVASPKIGMTWLPGPTRRAVEVVRGLRGEAGPGPGEERSRDGLIERLVPRMRR